MTPKQVCRHLTLGGAAPPLDRRKNEDASRKMWFGAMATLVFADQLSKPQLAAMPPEILLKSVKPYVEPIFMRTPLKRVAALRDAFLISEEGVAVFTIPGQ